jgi:H+-transporting ATPase
MPASGLAGSADLTIAEALAKFGTNPKTGLNPAQIEERLNKYGPNALPEEKTSALSAFLAYFWGPIPWMIEAAGLTALIVRDWGDFTIITSLLLFNALLGFWEEHEASNALDALKNSLALKARVLRGGEWQEVDAGKLAPGDIVRLYLGDVVPADCKLIQGDYISIDQSALTGESLPVTRKSGEDAYSGSVVKQGEMVAVITATGANTFFGRTAKLVAAAGSVSHFQRAVMKIGNFLIILALVLVVILVASRLFDMRGHYDRAVLLRLAEIVLILLVASVPVAMPAVLSVTMALGARMLARSKAIVSRLESIEELAGVDVLCSDKTGTLTENKLTLGQADPWAGTDAATLILMASLASRVADNDPIDLAVVAGLKDPSILRSYQQERYVPFDPVDKRTEATIKDLSGKIFRVTKGAPQVILALAKLSGSDLEKATQTVNTLASRGYRTIGVAVAQGDGPWVFQGILPLLDPPRPDSKSTIAKAQGEDGYRRQRRNCAADRIGIRHGHKYSAGNGTLPRRCYKRADSLGCCSENRRGRWFRSGFSGTQIRHCKDTAGERAHRGNDR